MRQCQEAWTKHLQRQITPGSLYASSKFCQTSLPHTFCVPHQSALLLLIRLLSYCSFWKISGICLHNSSLTFRSHLSMLFFREACLSILLGSCLPAYAYSTAISACLVSLSTENYISQNLLGWGSGSYLDVPVHGRRQEVQWSHACDFSTLCCLAS